MAGFLPSAQGNHDTLGSEGVEEAPTKDACALAKDNIANSRSSDVEPEEGGYRLGISTSHDLEGNNPLSPRKSYTVNDPLGAVVSGQDVSIGSVHLRHASEDRRTTDRADRIVIRFMQKWTISRRWSYGSLQEHLEDQLVGAIVPSPDPHRRFLPSHQLLRLVTQKAVENELARYEFSPRKRLQVWKPPVDIRLQARTICGGMEYPESVLDVKYQKHPRDVRRQAKKSYRKIFAILLLLDVRPSRIKSFIEEGVCDDDLPLVKVAQTNALHGSPKLRRKKDTDDDTPLSCFKKWRGANVERFEQRQWTVLAPVFTGSNGKEVPHHILQPEEVLPFTSWREAADEGGFGQVYRVEIHPDHHTFNTAEARPNIFAVKALKSGNKDAFTQEAGILKNLSSEKHAHPHLITLLSTYEQLGKYYLIFPWAEADLLGYWKDKNPEPFNDREDMARWLAEQCQGLSEALSRIHHYETFSGTSLPHHKVRARADSKEVETITLESRTSMGIVRRLFGRHGDIKPNNILWFPDQISRGGYGVLKITDFGIAHFSTENRASARDRGPVANSPTYRAPECDLPDGELTMLCDIWALGCVYLEFIAWFFNGWGYVEEFALRRLAVDNYWGGGMECDQFFVIEKDEKLGALRARVKDDVLQVFDELRSHRACSRFFSEFLDTIEHEMLVVQRNDPGQQTAGRRCSNAIARKLGSMKDSCDRDPNYVAQSSNLPGD